MDYQKVFDENLQLKESVQRIQTQFNNYIMREKEFRELEIQCNYYRSKYEQMRNKTGTQAKTIEFLRQKVEKLDRKNDGMKKTINFLRDKSADTSLNSVN